MDRPHPEQHEHPEQLHRLLALLSSDDRAVRQLWRDLDLDPAALLAALAAHGVEPTGPAEPDPAGQTHIDFPWPERDRVLYALLMAHPPGSGVLWGWSERGEDCRVTVTGDGADLLLEVVRDTVAEPATVRHRAALPDSTT